MSALPETPKAVLLFLYVMLGNAATIGIVRYISGQYQTFQIVFFTSFIAVLCFLPWAIRHGKTQLKTQKTKLLGLRAVLEFVAFSSSFYALTLIPLPMHTSLLFTTPIFGTVVAMWVLKERATWVTYGCVATGFIGVLVITQPDVDNLNLGVVFALLAAMGFAFCGSVIKMLTRTEPSTSIAFYMLLMTSVIAAPFAIAYWQYTPGLHDLPWLLALGIIAFSIQKAVALAISKVPFMTLIPLNFAQLVFVSIIAYFFFSEVITPETIVGSALIIAATLYNAYFASKQVRRMAAEAEKA